MKNRFSSLLQTTAITAVIGLMSSHAHAGSGSIAYQITPVSNFGSAGTGDGQFSGDIEQVSVGSDGNLYVADASNQRVQIFDANGTYLSQLGTPGNGPGQFSRVIGVDLNNDGRIAVTDGNNNTLQLFDATTHAFISEISSGSWGGTFDGAGWLDTDSSGNIYVSDFGHGVTEVFDHNGVYLSQFGPGNPLGGVAVDSVNHRIYVTEYYNDVVDIYDSSYNLIGTLATAGSGNGQVTTPVGVTVDNSGNVYVADLGNNRVDIFDKNGNFLTSYAANEVPGVGVGNNGYIYSPEYNNSVININQLTSTETFSSSPTGGGDEVASTPLSNLVLNGTGVFDHSFIGYQNIDVNGDWTLNGFYQYNTLNINNGGVLTLNGTTDAPGMYIYNGGTLAGTGTVHSDVRNQGTISPGDHGGADIGTLTITDQLFTTAPTAVLAIDVNAAGQSDKLVIGGGGNAGLDGTLAINELPGTYHVATSYLILTTDTGVFGTFSNVTSNLAFLDPTLDYSNPNEVILTLTRNDGINPFPNGVDFTPYAGNANASAIAPALSSYSMTQFNGDTATSNTVQGLSVSDAGKLLNEVSPDKVAAMPQMQAGMITNMQTPLFQRLQSAPSSDNKQGFGFVSPEANPSGITPDQVWTQAIGGVNNQDSSSNGAAGYRLGTVGVRAGADKDISTTSKLGLSFAYAHGTANYKDSDDSSQTQYVHADLYGRQIVDQENNVIFEGFLGAGGGRLDETRYITAGGLNNQIIGNTNAYDVSGAAKISKPIRMNNTDIITPSITGSASWTRQNGFSESGGPFALHMESITATPITINPMVDFQHTIKNEKYGYNIIPDFGVGATWQVTDLNDNVNANFAGATGTPGFTVSGAKQAPVSLNFSAAVTMQPFTSNKLIPQLTAQATQQASHTTTNTTATLTAKWDW